MKKITSFLAFFGSIGTLTCCVLPAVIALIAGGAAVGTFISIFPWIVVLSQNKIWIFWIAGGLILLNGVLIVKQNGTKGCAIIGGKGCHVTDKFSKIMFWAAVIIYSIGLFFSYLLIPLLKWIN